MKNQEILTTDEAAEYIRFSKSSLESWRSAGEGPRITKLRGKVFYRVSDLDAWIDEQAEKAE
jgi:predicted DNA-binding transcriptional regulator AlpA